MCESVGHHMPGRHLLQPVVTDCGGRAKRYFQITAKGVKEVRDAQRMLTNMWRNLSVLQGELA